MHNTVYKSIRQIFKFIIQCFVFLVHLYINFVIYNMFSLLTIITLYVG